MGIVISAFSAICNFISGAAPAIGVAISNFAKNAVTIVAKLPVPGIDIIKAIYIAAKIVHAVVEILGIKSEDNPEILGAKAEQCDKSIEEFDNDVEAYIKYLKDEVELDKEKYDSMSAEEKLGCSAIGMALETKAIEQKIGGIEISPECLAVLTQIQATGFNVDAKELVSIVSNLKLEGIDNMNDVVQLLEGKGDSDRLRTGEALVHALGEGGTDKLIELQDIVRKYE